MSIIGIRRLLKILNLALFSRQFQSKNRYSKYKPLMEPTLAVQHLRIRKAWAAETMSAEDSYASRFSSLVRLDGNDG
jgi:hypothetical protein